jgi:hypothetical protein
MLPFAAVKLAIGRGFHVAADSQERTERVERMEAPVKAERVLVQVSLKVLGRHAVMAAAKPGFEVAENKMGDREIIFRHLPVGILYGCEMFIATICKVGTCLSG